MRTGFAGAQRGTNDCRKLYAEITLQLARFDLASCASWSSLERHAKIRLAPPFSEKLLAWPSHNAEYFIEFVAAYSDAQFLGYERIRGRRLT